MAESIVLSARPREGRGTRAAHRLRQKEKLIPGVVYGHKEAVETICVPHDDLASAVRHHARTLDVELNGKRQTVLIQELQYDHLGMEILHVDFRRVSKDERITLSVPIEVRGTAPGATGGGVLDQPLHALHVECLALAVPESIRVNVGELQIGQAIHVKELKLPEGVKALDDPDLVVVQVRTPAAEAAPAPAEEGTAEPEVITARKKEEEGEE